MDQFKEAVLLDQDKSEVGGRLSAEMAVRQGGISTMDGIWLFDEAFDKGDGILV